MLKTPYEKTAKDFLELASNQRLAIIFRLLEKKSKVSTMAKELDSTTQEISRNFDRLVSSGLITKDIDGFYHLTTFGELICTQVPSLAFLSEYRDYFEKHNFGDLSMKFIQRIGALENGQFIKGFVKVQETWRQIYKNADEYICNILTELPLELIELGAEKIREGVKKSVILSESTVVPKGRKDLVEKLDIRNLVQEGKLERKMKKNVQIIVVLNEKEACVLFPTIDGEADLSQTFYSDDEKFHEWCLDYFRYCWHGSDMFQESKLKE